MGMVGKYKVKEMISADLENANPSLGLVIHTGQVSSLGMERERERESEPVIQVLRSFISFTRVSIQRYYW